MDFKTKPTDPVSFLGDLHKEALLSTLILCPLILRAQVCKEMEELVRTHRFKAECSSARLSGFSVSSKIRRKVPILEMKATERRYYDGKLPILTLK